VQRFSGGTQSDDLTLVVARGRPGYSSKRPLKRPVTQSQRSVCRPDYQGAALIDGPLRVAEGALARLGDANVGVGLGLRIIAKVPIAGGESRPLPGGQPGDLTGGWTSDGSGVYLQRLGVEATVRVVRVRDGAAETLRLVRAPDPAGVAWLGPVVVAGDGRSYAYSYMRILSGLYVVDGLR